MNDVLELINAVREIGATLRADPPDLVIKPAGKVPPELRTRLRERKPEILAYLSFSDEQLSDSMKRLETAGVCIAISEDGDMRVVLSDSDTLESIAAGATIYSPRDMYLYVTLSERERRMLHAFKKRFGGSTEWKTGIRRL